MANNNKFNIRQPESLDTNLKSDHLRLSINQNSVQHKTIINQFIIKNQLEFRMLEKVKPDLYQKGS